MISIKGLHNITVHFITIDVTKKEAQGPWRPASPFATWNQQSFIDNGNVAEVTSRRSVTYLQIARKSDNLYFPLITILSVKFGWNWMKTVGPVAFWKSKHRNLCKMHWMTPDWTQRIRHKMYPTYAVPRSMSPNFSSVSLYDQLFSSYSRFRTLRPLTTILKFRSAAKLLKLEVIAKKSNNLYFTMVDNVLIKCGWDQMKTVGGKCE